MSEPDEFTHENGAARATDPFVQIEGLLRVLGPPANLKEEP